MKITSDEVKEKFKEYLISFNNSETEASDRKYNTDQKNISIFTYADEFEKFLNKEFEGAEAASIKTSRLLNNIPFKDGIFQEGRKQKTDFPVIGIINDLLIDADIKYIVDTDGENGISSREISSFIKKIDLIDGKKGELSLKDIIHAVKELKKLKLPDNAEPENEEAVQQRGISAGNQPASALSPDAAAIPAEPALKSAANGVSAGNPAEIAAQYAKPAGRSAEKQHILEKLRYQKKIKMEQLSQAESDYEAVFSGKNAAAAAAQDEFKKADENYKKLLDNEKNLKNKYKKDIAAAGKIKTDAEKQKIETGKKLQGIETNLADNEHIVSEDEAALHDLEGRLDALEKMKSQNPEKEKIEEINAQIERYKIKILNAKDKLAADTAKLAELKNQHKETQEAFNSSQEKLQQAEEALKEIEAEYIEQNEKISNELKEALKVRNDAEKKLTETRSAEASAADAKIKRIRTELNEINKKIRIQKNETRGLLDSSPDFDVDYEENLTPYQQNDLENFKENFKLNRAKYAAVQAGTGMPAELIAAIHWRESRGKFNTYLHNGQKLGQKTTLEPKGIYFGKDQWEDAAADAVLRKLKGSRIKADTLSIKSLLDFAERYNGLGYRKKGAVSPYVWSGTDKYKGGMYVKDGTYNADYIDTNLGIAVMLKAALGLKE